MRSLAITLWLVSLVMFTPGSVQAGPLKDIEDSGSKPDRSPSRGGGSHSSSYSSDHDDDDDDDDDDDSGWGLFMLYVMLSPWVIPNQLVDDPCLSRYALRPYADGRGNLRSNEARLGCGPPSTAPLDAPWPPPPSKASRAIAAQLALEGGYALAFSDITAATMSARLQLPRRLELSGRFSVLTDLDERPREQAVMGTAHLSARFAQAAHVELRSGVGLRTFGLDKLLGGLDFLYAIDIYGNRPIVANLEFHGGFLGHAGVVEARMTLGYLIGGVVELYGGYDHTRIRGSAGTTRLSGPLLGLRAYF